MQEHPRTAILAGATGLVGGQTLQALLDDPQVAAVHVVGRRAPHISHPKLAIHLVDFTHLPALPQADEIYLALGTTIRVAGSQAAFRAVDLDANLAVARAAAAAGARRIGVVSAAGANAHSRVFYNRTKGELEDALRTLNLDALVIAQPSLLLGDRASLKQPFRPAEVFAGPLAQILAPVLPGRYRPVHARAVAQALVRTVPTSRGVRVLASDLLATIGAPA